MNSPYNSYRVCLYVVYRIPTIDLGDLDPMAEAQLRWLIRMGVNSPKRVVFSLRCLATWQLVYGLGQSLVKTTYHLWPA